MTFWQSTVGKILRWVLFLPVGLLVSALLESIPIFAYRYAANVELRLTLLTLIIGVIVVSMLFTVLVYWFIGVFFTPKLSCGMIAPTPKIASVIFGTLFVLFQGLTLLGMVLGDQTGWGIIIYKSLFSLLLMGGVVATYVEESD
ncbi:MAG: hypothetical protein H3C27_01775 [Opitutaceae bacterium]|nr:hypothetical protein [Opitutaceae bacterium]